MWAAPILQIALIYLRYKFIHYPNMPHLLPHLIMFFITAMFSLDVIPHVSLKKHNDDPDETCEMAENVKIFMLLQALLALMAIIAARSLFVALLDEEKFDLKVRVLEFIPNLYFATTEITNITLLLLLLLLTLSSTKLLHWLLLYRSERTSIYRPLRPYYKYGLLFGLFFLDIIGIELTLSFQIGMKYKSLIRFYLLMEYIVMLVNVVTAYLNFLSQCDPFHHRYYINELRKRIMSMVGMMVILITQIWFFLRVLTMMIDSIFVPLDTFNHMYKFCGSVYEFILLLKAASLLKKRFPSVRFEELEDGENICLICRELLQTNAIRLPCRHSFHMQCLCRWVMCQTSCPTCRFDIFHVLTSGSIISHWIFSKINN